jgi:hypothetical protein
MYFIAANIHNLKYVSTFLILCGKENLFSSSSVDTSTWVDCHVTALSNLLSPLITISHICVHSFYLIPFSIFSQFVCPTSPLSSQWLIIHHHLFPCSQRNPTVIHLAIPSHSIIIARASNFFFFFHVCLRCRNLFLLNVICFLTIYPNLECVCQ